MNVSKGICACLDIVGVCCVGFSQVLVWGMFPKESRSWAPLLAARGLDGCLRGVGCGIGCIWILKLKVIWMGNIFWMMSFIFCWLLYLLLGILVSVDFPTIPIHLVLPLHIIKNYNLRFLLNLLNFICCFTSIPFQIPSSKSHTLILVSNLLDLQLQLLHLSLQVLHFLIH